MPKTRRRVDREQFWRDTIAAWKQSGQTVTAFCAARGIAEATFFAKRRELTRRDQSPNAAGVSFAAVRVIADPAVEIVVPDGLVVRVPVGAGGRRRPTGPSTAGCAVLTLGLTGRIWICTTPQDGRKSFDGLQAVVTTHLGKDPLSGDLYVFRNKRGDRLKILAWQGDGFALYLRRLEKGTFAFPKADTAEVSITATELAMILGGVELGSAKTRPRYEHPGCMMHVRRYFFDARLNDPERAHEALARIRALYAVEQAAKQKGLTGSTLAAYRRQHAGPVLTAFAGWLAEHRPRVLPKSAIGEAFTYAMNQWPTLGVYLTDGRLTIDNAAAERAIRPLAVGRRNWLHLGGDGGLKPTAILLSIAASIKRQGLNPWVYLKHVLTELPARPLSADLTDLLPDVWTRSRAGLAAIPA